MRIDKYLLRNVKGVQMDCTSCRWKISVRIIPSVPVFLFSVISVIVCTLLAEVPVSLSI